jgi:hypothetical protein
MFNRLSACSNCKWTGQILTGLDSDFALFNVDGEAFGVGNVVTNQCFAGKGIDNVDLAGNCAQDGVFGLVTRKLHGDHCILAGLVNLVAKSANFDRGDCLDDCIGELGFEKLPVDAGHAAAGIEADKVVLAMGRGSHCHFEIIRIPKRQTGASDRRCIGSDDVWIFGSLSEDVSGRPRLSRSGSLVLHLAEVFEQFVSGRICGETSTAGEAWWSLYKVTGGLVVVIVRISIFVGLLIEVLMEVIRTVSIVVVRLRVLVIV